MQIKSGLTVPFSSAIYAWRPWQSCPLAAASPVPNPSCLPASVSLSLHLHSLDSVGEGEVWLALSTGQHGEFRLVSLAASSACRSPDVMVADAVLNEKTLGDIGSSVMTTTLSRSSSLICPPPSPPFWRKFAVTGAVLRRCFPIFNVITCHG